MVELAEILAYPLYSNVGDPVGSKLGESVTKPWDFIERDKNKPR